MLLIRNARLIHDLTEDYDNEYCDILISDGKFEKIAPQGTIHVSDDIRTVDLKNRTVLPGMFDLHMHLYLSSANFDALALRSHNDYVFDSIQYAGEMIKQGFTTLRDAGTPYYIGVALRDAIDRGIITGPRLKVAGTILTPTAKGNDSFSNLYYEIDSPQDIKRSVRREYAMGVDWIKYMGTGSVANLTGVPGELITSREELSALKAEAELKGIPTMVHCHGREGIRLCAEVGIDTIEHASMIDSVGIEMILKNNGKTSIVPTLDPVVQMHRNDDCGLMPKIIMDKIGEVYENSLNIVKASRAGILTGFGTDVSMPFFVNHPGYEFDVRREVGYDNIEILKQATINSARIIGVEEQLGTIKEGKLADMVVINGEPDKDIMVMKKMPEMVFKEGNLIVDRKSEGVRD